MRANRGRTPLALLAILWAGAGFGASPDKPAYDRDGNEVIDTVEYAKYVLDLHSPPLSRFDENLDGRIDGSELETASTALGELEGRVSGCVEDFMVDYPDGQDLASFVAQASICDLRPPVAEGVEIPERLMVRSSTEDLVIFKPSGQDTRKGALFSFARNVGSGQDVASIQGSIFRPINLARGPENADKIHYLVPSVSLNLISDDSGKEKDIDTVTFKAAYETGFSSSLSDWTRFSIAPVWTTDTRFNLDIRSIDLQLEPTLLGTGMNAARTMGPFRFRWRGFLQSEWGTVEDNDDRPDLPEGESFGRLGGKVAFRLWPTGLLPGGAGDRLILDAEYLYLWRVSGDFRDRTLFRSSLSYILDPAEHFKLETTYTNGDTTPALENEESWRIGIGVVY